MTTLLAQPGKYAFTHVHVVTMKDQVILPDRLVVVEGDRITYVGDAALFKLPEGAVVIEGEHRYLMPGLTDMHMHLGDNPDDLLLYLVNGVTTIRNMWGYERFRPLSWLMGTRVFQHLALRDAVCRGTVLGPTIVTAGPLLEGEKPFFPTFMVQQVTTTQRATEVVHAQAAKGYDLVKFYSTLSAEVFAALVMAARERGIPLAGHVPDAVGLGQVIHAGVASVEHLLGFFNPYAPELAVKPAEIAELAQLSAQHGVFHCPTLIAWERICNVSAQAEYEQDPEMAYLPARVKKGMRFLMKSASNHIQKRHLRPNHDYLPQLTEVIQTLRAQGAPLLLGTDKATPYVVAGFAVHRELQLLAKAGLTPFEAIAAGTVNAAKCLGKEAEFGTLEVGKRADLLLVDENPLVNLATIKSHSGVMARGRWLSRERCDEILLRLKQQYGQ